MIDSEIIKRNDKLPFRGLTDEILIINPKTRQVHVFNGTGAIIWELLEKPMSVSDLAITISKRFGTAPKTTIRNDVEAFVCNLMAQGLASFQKN